MQTINLPKMDVNSHTLCTAKSWVLSKRQLCDLECLLTKVYSPLNEFLDRENYDLVCETMRLKNGALCPMPITLDVSSAFAAECEFGEEIVLTNQENQPLASMMVHAIWKPNKKREAELVFGTSDKRHPGVAYLFDKAGDWYLGGAIRALHPIIHYDFLNYRHTPEELKQLFKIYGWSNIVAIQTRNPLHCGHFELMQQALAIDEARLLIHPVIGMTMPRDIDPVIRMKCYEKIIQRLPSLHAQLSVIPMSVRMAGPREALWHALIQKNYGATQVIIGQDHASPGLDNQDRAFYSSHDAQSLCEAHAKEIGINILALPPIVYQKNKLKYVSIHDVGPEDTFFEISSRELRRKLESDENIPDWYLFPDILTILKKAYPPKRNQGYTLFFTGLPRTEKLTIAHALLDKIIEANARTITFLNDEVIQKHTFNQDVNIQYLGFMAAEITKHHGIALCVATAPSTSVRQNTREHVSYHGGFIEVYVSTPLQPEDAYEPPTSPEVMIEATTVSIDEAVNQILNTIEALGYSWRHASEEMQVA